MEVEQTVTDEKVKTKVYIIESEAGWGSRVDETKEFDSREEAIEFCKKYNDEHNPPRDQTPEWYMYARLAGQKQYNMIRSDDCQET